MAAADQGRARVPPRWVVISAWRIHRALYRATNHRKGLWNPSNRRGWAPQLAATGRRPGQERAVIIGYLEDGPSRRVTAHEARDEERGRRWARCCNRRGSPALRAVSRRRGTA